MIKMIQNSKKISLNGENVWQDRKRSIGQATIHTDHKQEWPKVSWMWGWTNDHAMYQKWLELDKVNETKCDEVRFLKKKRTLLESSQKIQELTQIKKYIKPAQHGQQELPNDAGSPPKADWKDPTSMNRSESEKNDHQCQQHQYLFTSVWVQWGFIEVVWAFCSS